MAKTRAVLGCVLFAVVIASATDIKISGYAQPRWEATLAADSMPNSFRIRRAYLGVSGGVGECFSYKVLLTIPGTSISLYDAYVDIKPFKPISLRIGQFQTPIGMEKLVSSSAILFPERTFASGCDEFELMDRDIGVMLGGKVKFVGAQVGVFNGEGMNQKDKDRAKDLAARLTLEPWGILHLGGAYQMGKLRIQVLEDSVPVDSLLDFNRYGAEFSLSPGNLWLAAEFMGGKDDTVSSMTYYAEVAWMFKLGLSWLASLQPAVRYEWVDPDNVVDGDASTVITGGINLHFIEDDKAKLALCYRMILEEETAVDNDQIIAQLQLKF